MGKAKGGKEIRSAEKSSERGPGRPPSDDPRVHRVTFRFSEQEANAIEAAAKQAGMTVANWARTALVNAARLAGMNGH